MQIKIDNNLIVRCCLGVSFVFVVMFTIMAYGYSNDVDIEVLSGVDITWYVFEIMLFMMFMFFFFLGHGLRIIDNQQKIIEKMKGAEHEDKD